MAGSNYNVFPQPGSPVVGAPQGFSNVWTGPQQEPAATSATPGPRPVVTANVTFGDGASRLIVGLYRYGFQLPSNWPTNGWRPVRVQPTGSTYANWPPYLPNSTKDQSLSSTYDARMNDGNVVFYLDGNLGNAGNKSGRSWPPGWWIHSAKGVWPQDLANFTWGTAQLAGGMTQVVNAVAAQQGQPPMPMPGQGMQFQGPPPPPPGLSPIAKIAAVVVIGGILYYVL